MNGLLCFLTAGLLVCVASTEEPTPYKITTKRANDRVEVKAEKDSVVFVVTSPMGISQATIERTGENWPATVFLHLNLKGLESFRVGHEKLTVNAAVSSTDGSVRVWKDNQETPGLDAKNPLWLTIRKREGAFEITLPRAFLEGNPKSITVNWIDFYRG